MKNVLSALALSFLAFAAQAQSRPDTIVVRLPNQAVLTLQVRDARQLRQLPQYHLDSLVARLGTYIERADAAAKVASTDKVTLEFHPNQDQPGQGLPEEIRVTTYKAAPGTTPTTRLDVQVGKDPDSKPSRKFNLSLGGSSQAQRDSTRAKRLAATASGTDFTLDLGLNALVNRAAYALPGGQPGTLDLRPFGSRYVSLGLLHHQRLGGPQSPLALLLGPEFSFNNYMLEGNYKWVNQNNYTSVVPETSGRSYQKTKLATSAITLPVMLQLNLRDQHHRRTLTLGAGGFVAYRLASWTKLKYYEDNKTTKDKDYGSYNLNNWQYGLEGTIGLGHLTLFAKYNLNNLFRDGQGPQAQTLAFGIRLLGY